MSNPFKSGDIVKYRHGERHYKVIRVRYEFVDIKILDGSERKYLDVEHGALEYVDAEPSSPPGGGRFRPGDIVSSKRSGDTYKLITPVPDKDEWQCERLTSASGNMQIGKVIPIPTPRLKLIERLSTAKEAEIIAARHTSKAIEDAILNNTPAFNKEHFTKENNTMSSAYDYASTAVSEELAARAKNKAKKAVAKHLDRITQMVENAEYGDVIRVRDKDSYIVAWMCNANHMWESYNNRMSDESLIAHAVSTIAEGGKVHRMVKA